MKTWQIVARQLERAGGRFAMEKTITAFDDSSSHIKSIVASYICVCTKAMNMFGVATAYMLRTLEDTIRSEQSKRTERNRNTTFFSDGYILAVIRRNELPMATATFKKQRVEGLCDFFFFCTFLPLHVSHTENPKAKSQLQICSDFCDQQNA